MLRKDRVVFLETVIDPPSKLQKSKECLVQSATFEVCNWETLVEGEKNDDLQNDSTGLKNPVEVKHSHH